jgi:hypothetical protein
MHHDGSQYDLHKKENRILLPLPGTPLIGIILATCIAVRLATCITALIPLLGGSAARAQ